MRLGKIVLLLVGLFLLISGCAKKGIQEDTEPPACVCETPVCPAQDTPLPSPTTTSQEPTAAATTDTPKPTSTPVLTPTPTQFSGFDTAWVYRAMAYTNETLFYFIVPNVEADYYGTVDGLPMTCKVDKSAESLLVCRAEKDLTGIDYREFAFYADEQNQYLVYKGYISTRLDIMPTSTAITYIWPRANFTMADVTFASTPKDCNTRGQNIICEEEFRNYDGQCLVGFTCFDDCGFFYSVDTIKNREGDFVFTGPCW